MEFLERPQYLSGNHDQTGSEHLHACVVCGHQNSFKETESFRVGNTEGAFVRCPFCGIEMAQPLAYEAGTYTSFYDDNALLYWTIHCPESQFGDRAYRLLYPAHRWIVEQIENFPRSLSILDVGCGPGWVLGVLKGRGFSNIAGLEIASNAAAVVRQKGIPVILGTVESPPEEIRPNVVILSEVLEHLPDPVNILKVIRVKIRPSVIFATTPSRERWAVRLKIRGLGDWPPGHLVRWTSKGIRIAFERAGYSSVEIRPTRPDGREIWLQLLNNLTAGGRAGVDTARIVTSGLRFLARNIDRTVPLAGIFLSPVALALRSLGMKGRSWCISARTHEEP